MQKYYKWAGWLYPLLLIPVEFTNIQTGKLSLIIMIQLEF